MRRKRRRSRVVRSRVAIVGAFTIDELVQGTEIVERPGGAPIYSGMGVASSGGEAGAYTAWGEDFSSPIPSYIILIKRHLFPRTIRFRIGFENGTRVLTLVAAHGAIDVDLGILRGWDGIILNPVCNEVPWRGMEIDKPIGVDIQGFIRACEVGKPLRYSALKKVKISTPLTVFHSNVEELTLGGVSVEDLYEMGFREILVSDGRNGFTLYVKGGAKQKFVPSKVGNYEVGNGDYLLATYFTHRLNGLSELESAKEASLLTQEFSIVGPTLLPAPN